MGITKSESQTLIDAASKLKGYILCVKRIPGAPPRSAKLSAATVNHAARHRVRALCEHVASAILTHSIA